MLSSTASRMIGGDFTITATSYDRQLVKDPDFLKSGAPDWNSAHSASAIVAWVNDGNGHGDATAVRHEQTNATANSYWYQDVAGLRVGEPVKAEAWLNVASDGGGTYGARLQLQGLKSAPWQKSTPADQKWIKQTLYATANASTLRMILQHYYYKGRSRFDDATLWVDRTAPSTSFLISPALPDGDNGWYKTSPLITLTPNESADPYYKWGSGAWQPYAAPINAPDGAGKVLSYYSVDPSFNTESAKSSPALNIDTQVPQTFDLVSPSGGQIILNDVQPAVSWEASADNISGLAKYQLWIDGLLNRDNIPASESSTTPLAPLAPGWHTWTIKAIDNAGNERLASAPLDFRIIVDSPPVAVPVSPENNEWLIREPGKPFNLKWRYQDAEDTAKTNYTGFRVEVSNQLGSVISTHEETGSIEKMAQYLSAGGYKWRVQVRETVLYPDVSQWSEWSEPVSFGVIDKSTYTDTGSKDHWTYFSGQLAQAGFSANVWGGNNVLSQSEYSLPGKGPNIAVGRTYNSKAATDSASNAGPFGRGWSSNLTQELIMAKQISGDSDATETPGIYWSDPSGARHFFSKLTAFDYTAPPGLFVSLNAVVDSENNITGYVLEDKGGNRTYFDASGVLERTVDTNDNQLTFTYDINGLLTTVTDSTSRTASLGYTDNLITSITDNAGGRTFNYEYDGGDHLIRVTGPASYDYRYDYDSAENLVSVTDSKDRTSYFDYDGNDRLVAFRDARSAGATDTVYRTVLAYEPAPGNSGDGTTTVTDPLGRTVSYGYDEFGRVHTVQKNAPGDPDFEEETITVDAASSLVTGQSDANSVSSFTYDANGNALTEEEKLNSKTTALTSYGYDDTNSPSEPSQIIDPGGATQLFSYDENRNLSLEAGENRSASQFTYDSSGNLAAGIQLPSPKTQLIKNGRFEKGAASWNWRNGGSGTTHGSTTQSGHGQVLWQEHAVRSANSYWWQRVQSRIIGTIGQLPERLSYRTAVSAQVKVNSSGGGTGGARLAVAWYDSSGNALSTVYSKTVKNTKNRWVPITTRSMKIPAKAKYVDVRLQHFNYKGKSYFDNVNLHLTKLPSRWIHNSPYQAVADEDSDAPIEDAGLGNEDDGMETEDETETDRPDGWDWQITSGADPAYLWDDGVYYDGEFADGGEYSLKQTQSAPNSDSHWYKDFDPGAIEPGQDYLFSVFYRTEGSGSGGAKLWVGWNDADGVRLRDDQTAAYRSNGAWKRITVRLTAPDGADQVRIHLRQENFAGSVWFDSLQIVEQPNHEETIYDAPGNYPVKSIDAFGNETNYAYDAAGNLVQEIDPKGNRTAYDYDAFGRMLGVGQYIAGESTTYTTAYAYDEVGNLLSVVDAKGNATAYDYDAIDNLVKTTYPGPREVDNTYNAAGELEEQTQPNGSIVGFTYDNNGRPKETKLDGITTYIDRYKKDGNLGRTDNLIDGTTRTVSYSHNNADWVTAKKETFNPALPGGFVLGYTYDDNGNVTGLNAAGTLYTFDYNADGGLNAVNAPFGQTKLGYNDGGGLTSVEYPNNTAISTTYRAGSMVSQISNILGNDTLNFAYEYDANGNIATETLDNGANLYAYDELNRLTGWTDTSGTVTTYAYDPAGNLTNKGGQAFTYNANNQITNPGFTYDAAGNMTSDTVFDYRYDALDRLIEVRNTSDSLVAEYRYDSEGKRIKKTTPSGTIYYHYDGWKVVAETDQNGKTLATYTYADEDTPLTMTRGGQTYYYHKNARGDVVAVTDNLGNMVATYEYDPWGKLLSSTGNLENPYRYAGYRYDDETGLYYLRARYYGSSVSRFLTRDPVPTEVTNPLSLNAYTYADNDPVSVVDPTGLWGWTRFRRWISKTVALKAASLFERASDVTQAVSFVFGSVTAPTVVTLVISAIIEASGLLLGRIGRKLRANAGPPPRKHGKHTGGVWVVIKQVPYATHGWLEFDGHFVFGL